MANFEVANNPSTSGDGSTPAARLSKRREIITPDWYFQLAAEGRVFVSGDDVEATLIDGTAALVDTTPSYVLQGPPGTIVVPIYIECELVTEGGAAPNIDIVYVQSNSITISTAGSVIDTFNVKGGASPRASKAVHQSDPTLDALATGNNAVVGGSRAIPDNLVSVVGPLSWNVGTSATYEWVPRAPYMLTDGSMLLIYLYTGTSDSKWRTHFVWAELDAEAV